MKFPTRHIFSFYLYNMLVIFTFLLKQIVCTKTLHYYWFAQNLLIFTKPLRSVRR